MTAIARLLPGLPPNGARAIPFPERFGRTGREGIVVEFGSGEAAWSGNFQPGLAGLTNVTPHPDGSHVVVIANGSLWIVDPDARAAELTLEAVREAIEVTDPPGWIFSLQAIELARLGPSGVLWHTRRISWDGFRDFELTDAEIRGLAWSPVGEPWQPFGVDLVNGVVVGGSYWLDEEGGW